LCENKAVAILAEVQAGRPTIIHKDGGDYRNHNGDYRNHNFDADAKKRQLSTESFSPRAIHMDNPGQHDDWKSTSERTLSVP